MIVKAQANGSPVATTTISKNPVVSDLDPDLAALFATLNDLHKSAQAAIAKHQASLPPPSSAPVPSSGATDAQAPPAKPIAPIPSVKPGKPAATTKGKAAFSHFKDKKQRDADVASDPDLSDSLMDPVPFVDDGGIDPNDDPENDDLDPNDDPENVDDDLGIDEDDDPRSYEDDDDDKDPDNLDDEEDYSIVDRAKTETVDYGDEHGKRYPIDSKSQVKSAWKDVNKNSSDHNAIELVAIKGKIKDKAGKLGVDIPE